MNPIDAITVCFEYNLDDADLNYSLSCDFEEGNRVYYEQDPENVWKVDEYDGVFYVPHRPEFPALRERAQFPDCAPLKVSALGEFAGRKSTAVRVQLRGSLEEIKAYGEKIGAEFSIPSDLPACYSYRLVFDSFEGQNFHYALELIGASAEAHPRYAEMMEKFEAAFAETVKPHKPLSVYRPCHIKLPLTSDCEFNYKAYITVEFRD